MHAVKGCQTYWTLNSFYYFVWKYLFNFSQRWCIALVYFCKEFLLLLLRFFVLFCFFFFLFLFLFLFLLFQIALAREIKDALQPLKPLGGVHIWINSWSNFRNTEIWTILSCCFFLSDIIVMSSFMFRKMSFYYMDCPPLRAVWMTVFIFSRVSFNIKWSRIKPAGE